VSLPALPGNRILALWFGAILLAVAVVRVGDRIGVTQGQAAGFYIGSLFVWIIWLAWLVTWRWTGARQAEAPAGRWSALQLLLAVIGVIWLAATVFEYL
jgi:hypothetical protein